MTKGIEIAKDVPLPRLRTKRGTYDFVLKMQPGDSVPKEGRLSEVERNAVLARGRALGWRMQTEKLGEDSFRVWRRE